MKSNRINAGWLMLLALLSTINSPLSTLHAQGTAFTYQGRLQNNGSPASGVYDFSFGIYDAASGGTQHGSTLATTGIGVTNGMFTVTLDFGNQFSGSALWLGLSVRTNGAGTYTALSPRQPLMPTPYAIYAESASGLSGTVLASQLTSIGNTNGLGGNFFVGPSGNSTTTGFFDTANGSGALLKNTSGSSDTANGYEALSYNTSGSGNTAIGARALLSNTSGSQNTANGNEALFYNTNGWDNTASGSVALLSNTSGHDNTANGTAALEDNTDGSYNTADGAFALSFNTSGSNNIALGYQAGFNITTGSYNIDIGNQGFSTDTNIIRIGSGQSQTFIAGVINGNGGGLTNIGSTAIAPNAISTSAMADGAVTAPKIASGQVVKSLNGLEDAVSLIAGSNIALATNGNQLQISATGGAGSGWSLTGNSGTTAGANFLGTVDNQPLELKVYGQRALRLESGGAGAPNVIGGSSVNFVSPGVYGATIGGGGTTGLVEPGLVASNSVTSYFGTVGGGAQNAATNEFATVGGGYGNTAGGFATVGGGNGNGATYWYATVGGGSGNQAKNYSATVSGGFANVAGGQFATVGGGQNNTASGQDGTVGGGCFNILNGTNSTIAGGCSNSVGSCDAFIGGGCRNTITALPYSVGWGSTIAGGIQNSIFDGSPSMTGSGLNTIGGGGSNSITQPDWMVSGSGDTIAGGTHNSIFGDQGGSFCNTISGGSHNSMGNPDYIGCGTCTIGGGDGNTVAGGITYYDCTIAGGSGNTIGTFYSEMYGCTIGGGEGNFADGKGATVGGGTGNTIIGLGSRQVYSSTVGGGNENIINLSDCATIAGGQSNSVYGDFGTIPGGLNNVATNYAFAAGCRAKALQEGSFAWADSINLDYAPFLASAPGGGANSFNVRATGGFYVWTGVDPQSGDGTSGMYIDAGGSGWNVISDRNAKTNFTQVDGREILNRLAAIPMQTWNYKTQDSSTRHIGPMAQDFNAAFEVGASDKGGEKRFINSVDADGVALAAIQGLNQKLNDKDAEIQGLKQSVAELKAMVEKLAGK